MPNHKSHIHRTKFCPGLSEEGVAGDGPGGAGSGPRGRRRSWRRARRGRGRRPQKRRSKKSCRIGAIPITNNSGSSCTYRYRICLYNTLYTSRNESQDPRRARHSASASCQIWCVALCGVLVLPGGDGGLEIKTRKRLAPPTPGPAGHQRHPRAPHGPRPTCQGWSRRK
jgi:hypothetical protein